MIKSRSTGFYLLACGFLALLPLVGSARERVRIAGSDLLGAGFTAELEKHARENDLEVIQTFEGSRAALENLKARTADVALVMFAPDEKLPDAAFVVEPLAYRIAVVVVSKRIDVAEITFAQLDGFFGAQGSAGHSLWRDLGATGSAAQLSVSTHVLTDRNAAVSLDLFSHLALRTAKLKSSVVRHEKQEPLFTRLKFEEGGLALLPQLPPEGAEVRVLSVAKTKGEPAFGPTPENIHTGDYPLRWPLYVVYRREDAERLRSLRAFLWSDRVAKSFVADSYLTPVPAGVGGRLR